MSMTEKVRADARTTLFDALDDHRVGMLGVLDSEQHLQPMTHFADRETGELWFITSADTDLVRAVGLGARAHHCLMTPEGDFYACLAGTLEQSEDRGKLDELWSSVAAAWFDEGSDDPDVVLLRLAVQEAAIWTATGGGSVVATEIARANAGKAEDGREPDLGDHVVLRFDGA